MPKGYGYTSAKKKAAKKKATKEKGGTKGSKGGAKPGGGGGGADGLTPGSGPDPIVISGGGSVSVQFKPGGFVNLGGGNWKNGAINLASITIDGTTTALSRTSVITIKFA